MYPEIAVLTLGVRGSLRILRSKSPRQANVIQLQFYEGLTQEEVAAALDLSLETIMLDTRKAKALSSRAFILSRGRMISDVNSKA